VADYASLIRPTPAAYRNFNRAERLPLRRPCFAQHNQDGTTSRNRPIHFLERILRMTCQTPQNPPDDHGWLMKELDHIQAILGRYDSFFFWIKQVSVAGIVGALGIFVSALHKGNGQTKCYVYGITIIPLVFFMMDYGFRFAYWTKYVARFRTIRMCLEQSKIPSCRYQIRERVPFCQRARDAFQCFDLYWYVVWICVAGSSAYVISRMVG
jgi:hypothetical protein